jgi:hypothetical protein
MESQKKKSNLLLRNTIFLWLAYGTIALLAVPFVAMQFTTEIDWTWFDFIVAGLLLFGTGVAFVLTARKIQKGYFIIALLFAAALMLIWVELAVGIFGDG